VEVRFGKVQLERSYRDNRLARTLWGEKIARCYVQRIDQLYAAETARELFALRALRLHPLKGERQGQHALRLDDAWRVVVRFEGERLTIVTVEEVSKHYGD
jgi:plasmid maintenance system killer protein